MLIVSDLDNLWAVLEDHPSDDVTRLAIADCLEERDDCDRAACLRWLVIKQLRPFLFRREDGIIDGRQSVVVWNDGWYWWANGGNNHGIAYPHYSTESWGIPDYCVLPCDLWLRIPHSFDYEPGMFRDYETVKIAHEVVLNTFAGLPPDLRSIVMK